MWTLDLPPASDLLAARPKNLLEQSRPPGLRGRDPAICQPVRVDRRSTASGALVYPTDLYTTEPI